MAQLTPIRPSDMPSILTAVGARLDGTAEAAFRRIAATWPVPPEQVDTPAHHAAAIALARSLGIGTLDEAPAAAFSWDGRYIRTRSEASVLVHEVAHWLLCPPARRNLPDFGLGAGPETGRCAEANAARCVDDAQAQEEETLTSLLGILLEAGLDQPAILAFLEQNWLEGWQRPAAIAAFTTTVARLSARGLIDDTGLPACLAR